MATKLPRSLIKRLRVRARQDDISVQDLVLQRSLGNSTVANVWRRDERAG